MKQSSLNNTELEGLHVAMIMDGNGRWATARGLPRLAGHRAGVKTVRRMVESCPGLGIKVLTLYAFSSDNWKRPVEEVTGLMRMFRIYLMKEARELAEKGVRLEVIGRRDRLPFPVLEAIQQAEAGTCQGTRLRLRIAVDYSSRDALLAAATRSRMDEVPLTRQRFSELVGQVHHSTFPAPDVDLLVRTGGEQRLSDFLLWECAYAEFVFSKRMWPEFQIADLEAAVFDFQARERRFGAVPQTAVG
ncbi:MAG: di-trans,poly-cis-decaprenylcistransferase [Blastocatellia bacterium]|nr:di-trans,poly-cis-decaprenylcistransferase [Blastocatellia bacterium]